MPAPINTPYDNYEIHGCVERPSGPGYQSYVEQCPDEEADVWTLYGHCPGEGVQAIGDFKSRTDAEAVYHRITGQLFGSHEENEARVCLMQAAADLLAVLEPVADHGFFQVEAAYSCGDIEEGDQTMANYTSFFDAITKATGKTFVVG